MLAMADHQFRDLPQIPQNMDEPRYTLWPENHNYFHSYKHHSVNFPQEDDMYIDDFDSGMVSMQPMERFMQDQYPHPQCVLHANTIVERQLGTQYDQPWPSTDCLRTVSPDRTTSGHSSYATQNELHSPPNYHAIPYGSPTGVFSHSCMPYPMTEGFKDGGYAPNLISLRELEYEHPEPEPAMEDNDTLDLKQEVACDHEQVAMKVDTTTPAGFVEYADSGIGNSVRDAESVQPVDLQDVPEDPASDSDYSPTSSRSGNRRRSSASNGSPTRANKRSAANVSKHSNSNKVAKRNRRVSNATKRHIEIDSDRRPFPCPLAMYNCGSTFTSKNEWKRHVSTQHIKLGFWRCDLCPPTSDPNDDHTHYYNDFNRKDLFAQHLRRMHAAPKDSPVRSQVEYPVNEENLAEHQTRCFQLLRSPPQQSSCLFCEKTFDGPASWEERMEHVGRHFEKDKKGVIDMLDIKSWNDDAALEQYLLEEGLVAMEHGSWKIGDGKPRRLSRESVEDSDEE